MKIKVSDFTSFIHKITQLLHNWLEETSLHGIPKINRSKNPITKIGWSVFVFVSFTCSLFFIFSSLATYLSYKVVSQLSTIRQSSLIFPVVTFCSKQAFKTSSPSINQLINLTIQSNLNMGSTLLNSSSLINNSDLYYEYTGIYLLNQQNYSRRDSCFATHKMLFSTQKK
jgi:hypothetical protein